MVLFNYATKELTAKVVYYGPGLCGKTSNLQYIYDSLPDTAKGKMLSLATKTDRTLFFDFLPIDLGNIRGMKTKIQLYTVPGQVFYDTTRKLVLKGADGVVFVSDSQEAMLEANIDSFDNLINNLKEQNLDLQLFPHVIQYNKRDMKNTLPVPKLDHYINRFNVPYFEAVAITGVGVFETLKGISKIVLKNLTQKYGLEMEKETETSAAVPVSKPPSLPPVDMAAPEQDAEGGGKDLSVSMPTEELREEPVSEMADADHVEEIDFDEEVEDLDEFEEDADQPAAAAESGLDSLPSESKNAANLHRVDDSEVIELDDVEPLEVEELDEMAEIASMAGQSKFEKSTKVSSAPAQHVEPMAIPVNISLPISLAGAPLRLLIDITFEDK